MNYVNCLAAAVDTIKRTILFSSFSQTSTRRADKYLARPTSRCILFDG